MYESTVSLVTHEFDPRTRRCASDGATLLPQIYAAKNVVLRISSTPGQIDTDIIVSCTEIIDSCNALAGTSYLVYKNIQQQQPNFFVACIHKSRPKSIYYVEDGGAYLPMGEIAPHDRFMEIMIGPGMVVLAISWDPWENRQLIFDQLKSDVLTIQLCARERWKRVYLDRDGRPEGIVNYLEESTLVWKQRYEDAEETSDTFIWPDQPGTQVLVRCNDNECSCNWESETDAWRSPAYGGKATAHGGGGSSPALSRSWGSTWSLVAFGEEAKAGGGAIEANNDQGDHRIVDFENLAQLSNVKDGCFTDDVIQAMVFMQQPGGQAAPSIEFQPTSALAIADLSLWDQKDKWPRDYYVPAPDAGIANQEDRVVPALRIDLHPSMSVQDLADQIDQNIRAGVKDKGSTFNGRKGRNQLDGHWALLIQLAGTEFEIALVLRYKSVAKTNQVLSPTLIFRGGHSRCFETCQGIKKKKKTQAVRLDQLPCGILCCHVDGSRLTLVRFDQRRSEDRTYLGALKDAKTLLRRQCTANSFAPPASQNRPASGLAIAVPEDNDDDENDIGIAQGGAQTIETLLDQHQWPLSGHVLGELFPHGSGRTKIALRQSVSLGMIRHILGFNLPDIEEPVYSCPLLQNLRLMDILPRAEIEKFDKIADEWKTKSGGKPWGNFEMKFAGWDGTHPEDHCDMQEFLVKVPTSAQLEENVLTQEDRIILASRALAFGVFYVNTVRKNGAAPPARSYVEALERCAADLGLKHVTIYPVTVDVEQRQVQTKSYKELDVYAPRMFGRIMRLCVGPDIFLTRLVHNAGELQQETSFHRATLLRRDKVKEVVHQLSTTTPLHAIIPIFKVSHVLDEMAMLIEKESAPMAVRGATGNGKSVTMSGLCVLTLSEKN